MKLTIKNKILKKIFKIESLSIGYDYISNFYSTNKKVDSITQEIVHKFAELNKILKGNEIKTFHFFHYKKSSNNENRKESYIVFKHKEDGENNE